MVLDVPQTAARIARLHGARQVVLVLVDAMRFDLGVRVGQQLRESLAPDAVCAEQLLLWAALPTTTSAQLRLLARGPQAFAEGLEVPESEREIPVGRGKSASTVRRVRVGGREVHKLDIIQAALSEAGPPESERLDALAVEAATPLVRFAKGLAPRTLMFLFGDHGFELPATDHGTGPAQEGGATPEQVLVPGQAWLVGGIH